MIMFVEQFSTMPTRPGLVKAPSTCRSADIDERASLQSLVATESMLDLRNFASLHFIMQLFMAEMTRRTEDLQIETFVYISELKAVS